MSEHDEPKTALTLTQLIGEHPRGDWSDGTHSCQGCADRVLQELEAALASMGEGATQDEIRAARRRYNAASHPGWTREEYAAHLADILLAEGYATSPAPEATETVEWGLRDASSAVWVSAGLPWSRAEAEQAANRTGDVLVMRARRFDPWTPVDRMHEAPAIEPHVATCTGCAPVDRAADEHEEGRR